MHLPKTILFSAISLSVFLGLATFIDLAYGQNLDFEVSCPSCVDIPPEEIDLYKRLFPLIIWTDQPILDHSSEFTVNGFIRPENAFHPITFTVTNPIGNIVTVEQVTPKPTGDFEINFNTASGLWKKDGQYIIKAQSGAETRIFKISVELTEEGTPPMGCSSNEFSVDGYCIPYAITWAKINSANLDPDEKSLTINIETVNRGTLRLTPPNDVIQGVYMVLIDDKESLDFSISENTINIPFENGAQQIKILATFVIPEFQTIALLVLMVGLSIVLVWNRKGIGINRSIFLKN